MVKGTFFVYVLKNVHRINQGPIFLTCIRNTFNDKTKTSNKIVKCEIR